MATEPKVIYLKIMNITCGFEHETFIKIMADKAVWIFITDDYLNNVKYYEIDEELINNCRGFKSMINDPKNHILKEAWEKVYNDALEYV